MSAATKLKIVSLAVIYILHITFFDVLMSHGFANPANFSLAMLSHLSQHHARRNTGDPDEYSYRLLTKHELSKQVATFIPADVNVVLPILGFTYQEVCHKKYSPISRWPNASGPRLYCIFRSFLI